MCRLSVIICSRDPRRAYFTCVLESLQTQTLPTATWELILVDNGSARPLSEMFDLSWHAQHVHVREDVPGLTAARVRGIEVASGELLVFFDDDNVVASDYLATAATISAAHPFVSVFGAGTIEPEFEVEPRPKIRPLLPYLAVRSVTRAYWTNNERDVYCLPWGAGLCVTRSTARAYVQAVRQLLIAPLLDRCGDRLFSGGDDLFSWVATRTGSAFGIFPVLRITHLIRASRLRDAYLFRLLHDHAYSHGVLRYVLWGERRERSTLEVAIRVLLNGVRRGPFSMRCRWAAACGTERAERYIAAHRPPMTLLMGAARCSSSTGPETLTKSR
jgi:glycosyltransferase involved in cell wall biosynthesis